MPFLDKDGLVHLWDKIITRLNTKADKIKLDEVEAKLTEQIENIDLSEYVSETELDEKGYLTEHQSLEGYATETYVNNQIQSYVDESILGGEW